MRRTKYLYLKELFGSLDVSSELGTRALGELSDLRMFRKGAYVYSSEQAQPMVYFVKQGLLKMGQRRDFDEEMPWCLIGPGHIFGENKLFGIEHPGCFVKAISNTYALEIKVPDLLRLIQKHPNLSLTISQLSWKKVAKLQERLSDTFYKVSETRVIEFLHDFVMENGHLQDGIWSANNPFNHTDIAELTSTSRQTVNNLISKHRRCGRLIYNRKQISFTENSGIDRYSAARLPKVD